MNTLAISAGTRMATAMALGPAALADVRMSTVRRDPWVVLVVVAVALVIVLGLAAALWITCQQRGMYPALDMPGWQGGGTWKLYCRK